MFNLYKPLDCFFIKIIINKVNFMYLYNFNLLIYNNNKNIYNVYNNLIFKNLKNISLLNYHNYVLNSSIFLKNFTKTELNLKQQIHTKFNNFNKKIVKKKHFIFKLKNKNTTNKNVISYYPFIFENYNNFFKNKSFNVSVKKKLMFEEHFLDLFDFKFENNLNSFQISLFKLFEKKKYYINKSVNLKIDFYFFFIKKLFKQKINTYTNSFKSLTIDFFLTHLQKKIKKTSKKITINFFNKNYFSTMFLKFNFINFSGNTFIFIFSFVNYFNGKNPIFKKKNFNKLIIFNNYKKSISTFSFFKNNFNANFLNNTNLLNSYNFFLSDNSLFNIGGEINFINDIKQYYLYNNHYPIFVTNSLVKKLVLNKFKKNLLINYFKFIQLYSVNFLEHLFKKKIFIKISSNFFRNYNNNVHINTIYNMYKNNPFRNLKKFKVINFIEVVWYSFLIRDLSLLSTWVSRYMESLHFRGHKIFLVFFQNFFKKYSFLLIDVLKIEGFYFDIRGKVGVTGNSKKRHSCFKFGNFRRSSKKYKIDFNQNLVRTPSGVLGLTYMLSY